MTPPNVILGLAVQELATKLAYMQARRARVASALASLEKIGNDARGQHKDLERAVNEDIFSMQAKRPDDLLTDEDRAHLVHKYRDHGLYFHEPSKYDAAFRFKRASAAAELATQQLGGTPGGIDPMKRPPPPKLGKPIPTPSSSSTTKSADAACEGKPKRGIEPELTEKLRQDAEAQTPPADVDTAAKVAATRAEKLMMKEPALLQRFLGRAVENAGGSAAITPGVAHGLGVASSGAADAADRLRGLRSAVRDLAPPSPAAVEAEAARRAEEAAARDAQRQYRKMVADAEKKKRIGENAQRLRDARRAEQKAENPLNELRDLFDQAEQHQRQQAARRLQLMDQPGSKPHALAASMIPAAYVGIATPAAVHSARERANSPEAEERAVRRVYRTMLPAGALGSLGAATMALAPLNPQIHGAPASLNRLPKAVMASGLGMGLGALGGVLYHGHKERQARDAAK